MISLKSAIRTHSLIQGKLKNGFFEWYPRRFGVPYSHDGKKPDMPAESIAFTAFHAGYRFGVKDADETRDHEPIVLP